MINIRQALVSDAPAIIGFQLRMAWETEQKVLDNDTVTKGVYSVFSDEAKGSYFVASEDDKVIASLLITYEWSDWRNCNVWWFQSVYVLPEYRRKGVFRKMYQYIRELACTNDVGGLRLYVETNNVNARKTYESLGMSSEHYSFYEWMRK